MESLLFVLGWMLAGGLVAWWGVWPFVGRSLAGALALTVVPASSWLVVAALGLAGTAVSLELRAGGLGGVDLGPTLSAVTVALVSGAAAAWLLPFVAARPSRLPAVGAAGLLVLLVWPGVVGASFLWELVAVGASGSSGGVVAVLLVLAGGATAVLGVRASRRLVRASLGRRPSPSSLPVLPWVAGAVALVPALPVMGLAATLATVLFVPPVAVVTRPRGIPLALWSAVLGSLVGGSAGLGSLLGLPGGALAVFVVAVAGGWPLRLRATPEGEAS